MGTSYESIYPFFMQKISDSSLFEMQEEYFNEILKGYLMSALTKFKACQKDLSEKDDDLGQINVDLNDEEKEILGTLMAIEWLSPKINNIQLLKQTLTSKDFNMYSQANHLKELNNLKKELRREATQLISSYSYNNLGD